MDRAANWEHGALTTANPGETHVVSTTIEDTAPDNKGVIIPYLRERVPEFRRLDRLRQQACHFSIFLFIYIYNSIYLKT